MCASNLQSIQKSQFHLHSAHSTRTISAEGYPRTARNSAEVYARRRLRRARSPGGLPASTQLNVISPAFRAVDAHDLRRGLPASTQKGDFTCAPRLGHARSPQRVARVHPESDFTCIPRTRHARSPQRPTCGPSETQFHLHSAHSTRTIPAEGSPPNRIIERSVKGICARTSACAHLQAHTRAS